MKSSVAWIIILIVILAIGAWYFLSAEKTAAPAPTATQTTQGQEPSGTAGTNGSPNQGNMGQSDAGIGEAPQQPAGSTKGSIIGANLALGIDGNHLIAYNGMTVYTYDKDTTGVSNCTGTCATNWPPYLVGPDDNVAQLEAGISGKTSTITRADGSIQMTYNGMPLYFYVGDSASGDVKGDGVGGVWHVVKS